jgi:hypothetical protein
MPGRLADKECNGSTSYPDYKKNRGSYASVKVKKTP